MKYSKASSLILQGQKLEKFELLSFSKTRIASQQILGWEKSIFDFILTWLDEQDHLIVKTSGSTGSPKSIRIEKQHMVNSALKTGQFLDLKNGDSALLCLPVDFIAGKMMIVRAMVLGLDLTVAEPSGNPLLDQDKSFDFSAMVPLQLYQIFKEKGGSEKLNKINKLIVGGAAIPATLKEKIRTLTNQSFSTYGMTETVSHIAMERLNGEKTEGWFYILSGVEIKTDAMQRLIINAPDLAKELVTTNDLAETKGEDQFRILGRSDNMLISGGINIIPETIEKKLGKFIEQRFILSSQYDEKLGDRLVLVIEDNIWPDQNIIRLEENLSLQLKSYERPKEILFVDKLPETIGGKINRIKLRQMISGL